MEKIARKLTGLVGSTPLLELSSYNKSSGLKARLIMKIESFNPADSVKGHVALAVIEDTEVKGVSTPDTIITEPASGNTGVGLAFVAVARGYELILMMPDTVSVERRNPLRVLGTELVLTPGADGMKGTTTKAKELEAATPGSVILQQLENPADSAMHLRTTGLEIWRDTEGKVDIFAADVGTGRTISGAGEAPKMCNPSVKTVVVEPAGSPVLSDGKPGPHRIQGIGTGFVPKTYNASVVDEIIQVQNDDAIRTSRAPAEKERLLVGISSGAAVYTATGLTECLEDEGRMIVALLPDMGERYLFAILYTLEEYPL